MTAYTKLLGLRKEHTRAQLAAALDCSIAAVDRVLRNKEASEEMTAKIEKLTDAALKRVADVKDPGGKSSGAKPKAKKAKAAKPAKKAKPVKKADAAPTAAAVA
jgi:hypothetical protein